MKNMKLFALLNQHKVFHCSSVHTCTMHVPQLRESLCSLSIYIYMQIERKISLHKQMLRNMDIYEFPQYAWVIIKDILLQDRYFWFIARTVIFKLSLLTTVNCIVFCQQKICAHTVRINIPKAEDVCFLSSPMNYLYAFIQKPEVLFLFSLDRV